MSILAHKLARDLRAQRGQLLALVLVQGLGVTLFGASYAGYLNLGESYRHSNEQLALAAVHAEINSPGLDDDDVARVAALPGVARAIGRSVFIAPLALSPSASSTIDARVISLPDATNGDGEPALDRLLVESGTLPRSPHGVVVETHLAAAHHLHAGDHVAFRVAGAVGHVDVDAVVDGVVVSPEYLWVSRDARDPMPSPDTFGVVWARRSVAAEIAGAIATAMGPAAPEDMVLASHAHHSELLYDRADGARAADVDSAIDAALAPHAVASRTEAKDLVGPQLLQLDVDGMRVMALFFPVFFLGVAGFIALALLARIVDQQRQVIGTLRALGLSRAAVVRHTVAFGAVVGAAASIAGALLGALLARALTDTYAHELGVPFVTAGLHLGVIAAGLAAGSATSLVASLLPSWRAARVAPAEAMRPAQPDAGSLVRLSRHIAGLPLVLRLPLRNALRHPLRVIAAAIGVVCALVLVLATLASAQSISRVADVQLHDAQRFDVRVDLGAPLPTAELAQRIDLINDHSPGEVSARELSLTLPASVRLAGVERSLLLSCVAPDARLLRPVDFDGHALAASDGILLPRGEAKKLHAAVGDVVAVTLALPGVPSRAISLPV
ncbi:MAG TPA: FtsX-like permease family protein, partial [Myxococcota bacterium]